MNLINLFSKKSYAYFFFYINLDFPQFYKISAKKIFHRYTFKKNLLQQFFFYNIHSPPPSLSRVFVEALVPGRLD